jgi:hypothetical protein
VTERVVNQHRPRRYCPSNHCHGQTARIDQATVYLVRWSTVQQVHQRCPHCDTRLVGKPRDGGVRDLGPVNERTAA